MKSTRNIVFYTLFLLLTLSWVTLCVSTIIKTSSEKIITDKKEALPEGKSEVEEKRFEIVLEFSTPFSAPFQSKSSNEFQFSKETNIPQSIILDLSNPPPEINLFA
jgi:hypothetical protein